MKHICHILAALALLPPAAAQEAPPTAGSTPAQAGSTRCTVSPSCPDSPGQWRMLIELQAGEDWPGYYARATALWQREIMGKKAARAKLGGYVLRNPQAPAASRDIVIPCGPKQWSSGPFGQPEQAVRFLVVTFTPQGIELQRAKGTLVGPMLDAAGMQQSWSWNEADAFLAALPAMVEERLVIFSAAAGLPVADYWNHLAAMWQIAGPRRLLPMDEAPYVRKREDQPERNTGPERPGAAPEPEIEIGL